MKVGILGQGFSGIFLALFLKENNPKIDVTIIDKEETPGRKVLEKIESFFSFIWDKFRKYCPKESCANCAKST